MHDSTELRLTACNIRTILDHNKHQNWMIISTRTFCRHENLLYVRRCEQPSFHFKPDVCVESVKSDDPENKVWPFESRPYLVWNMGYNYTGTSSLSAAILYIRCRSIRRHLLYRTGLTIRWNYVSIIPITWDASNSGLAFTYENLFKFRFYNNRLSQMNFCV